MHSNHSLAHSVFCTPYRSGGNPEQVPSEQQSGYSLRLSLPPVASTCEEHSDEQMTSIDESAVARHRTLILGCLREEDPSIRRRALELLIALVQLNTVEEIVRELLQYLVW